MNCAVMYHMYYDDIGEPDMTPLSAAGINCATYINKVVVANHQCTYTVNDEQKIYFHSPNCGKDIGGRLVMIESFLKRNDVSEWIIFLHDKKSLHKATGNEWRRKLWEIINPRFVESALQIIKAEPMAGMIGPKAFRRNPEETDTCEMRQKIDELSTTYGIEKTDYSYIAGTMFWIRADVIRSFFSVWHPLFVRSTLEKGNVQDNNGPSLTHAWERFFSRIVTAQGFKIYYI